MTQERKSFMKRLQDRWGVSYRTAIIILLVFSCTGFSVMFLKKPILDLIIGAGDKHWVHSVIYYILIFPLYNVLLLIYGFIFGQFKFFWNFEKKFFSRLIGKKQKDSNSSNSQKATN